MSLLTAADASFLLLFLAWPPLRHLPRSLVELWTYKSFDECVDLHLFAESEAQVTARSVAFEGVEAGARFVLAERARRG